MNEDIDYPSTYKLIGFTFYIRYEEHRENLFFLELVRNSTKIFNLSHNNWNSLFFFYSNYKKILTLSSIF